MDTSALDTAASSAALTGQLRPGASLTTILGPETGRYFGEGYRHVDYAVWPSSGRRDGGVSEQWVGSVRYPTGWSLDGKGRERPQHLATVDAVVLAVAAWEREAVTAGEGSTPGSSRLMSVRVTAGTKPWLDLGEVPVRLVSSPAGGDWPGQLVEGIVGGLTVDLRIATADSLRASAATPPVGRDVAGTVYGSGFRATNISTRIEKADPSIGLLVTRHEAVSGSRPGTVTGLDSAVFPSLCAIDHLITMGQVAQALALAKMRRERAGMGNMWMRSVELHMEPSSACLPVAYEATCTIEQTGPRPRRSGTLLYDLTARSETSTGAVGVALLAYETKGREE